MWDWTRTVRTLVVGVALTLMACSPTSAERLMTVSQFRDLFGERLQASYPDSRITAWNESTLKIVGPDGGEEYHSVGNAYEIYAREPVRRDELLDRLLQSRLESQQPKAVTTDRLVIVIRPPDALTKIPGGGEPRNAVSRPFAGDLVQILAIDGEHSLAYANSKDIAELGVSEDEAWRRGVANVPVRVGELNEGVLPDAPDLLAVTASSSLAPSILVSPQACAQGSLRVAEGQAVLLVDRNMFLTTDVADPATERAFWNYVAGIRPDDVVFSRTPLVCRGGRWTVAMRP